jgi:V/A-type H+-transporting ATPase subunit E
MEMELKGIIEKIKEEGVEEGEKKAADIISQAEERARNAMGSAEKEGEDIIKKAEKEAEKLRKNGEEALQQASRDVLLSLRQEIVALFDRVIKEETAKQLSPELLKGMITTLVEKFEKNGETDVEVLLSAKDKTALEKMLLTGLKEKMAKGVTLKASPKVEKGFMIGGKGKESYYDFTDEAITEAFKAFLNPKITGLLNPGKENVG